MSENKKNPESTNDQVGSSGKYVDPERVNLANTGESTKSTQADGTGGADTKDTQTVGETVPKSQYDELEKKLGEQGVELGEARKYKDFFEEVAPLMEKLDADPKLVEAIVDGKINSELVKSVIEGEVSNEDAKKVTEAHKEVKKDLGDKKYEKTSPEEIEKLVSEKVAKGVGEVEKKFSQELDEDRRIREYESDINSFISRTPDFADFADDIQKYVDTHPEITDIEAAYDAVKGKRIIESAKQEEEEGIKEKEKDLATNIGGGESHSAGPMKDENLADQLIGGSSNPNIF